MKSVKLFFSLLVALVAVTFAAPASASAAVAADGEAAVAGADTQKSNEDFDKIFDVGSTLSKFVDETGFYARVPQDKADAEGFEGFVQHYGFVIMILISLVLLYLAIVKKFEPLLLLPIAFGMLLTNLPGANMFHEHLFAGGHVHWGLFGDPNNPAGLIDYLYLGVKLGIYPCLIFVGVGAMTDFGPLIANPKSLLLGAAAQFGIFAYSYMALVPVIQPPIMKALTTEKERKIEMKQLRSVSKTEKILFPIIITIIISLLLPSAAPLIGCLMLGNLLKECGVTERLSKTVQNELMNIVTIFLGISVGATATAATFLSGQTIKIMVMGVIAFSLGSASGVILAKVINLFSKEKINPLIGSAGVSAVPMAARVSQTVGQKYNPGNFLLMHAMGPNVAGVIGSAVAAGILLSFFPVA